jgi:hypothetical protein
MSSCQYAKDVGIKSLTRTWSGEHMQKPDLDIAMPRRAPWGRSFEETLRLCQEATRTFRGSEETLKCIQQVEECLRRLVDETN